MLEKLSEMTMTPTSELRFLLDAWLQARAPALHAQAWSVDLSFQPSSDMSGILNPLNRLFLSPTRTLQLACSVDWVAMGVGVQQDIANVTKLSAGARVLQ